jgi:hypothetical protein
LEVASFVEDATFILILLSDDAIASDEERSKEHLGKDDFGLVRLQGIICLSNSAENIIGALLLALH